MIVEDILFSTFHFWRRFYPRMNRIQNFVHFFVLVAEMTCKRYLEQCSCHSILVWKVGLGRDARDTMRISEDHKSCTFCWDHLNLEICFVSVVTLTLEKSNESQRVRQNNRALIIVSVDHIWNQIGFAT